MLTVNTILHPTDFSEASEAAYRLACSLARDYGARLILLHVAPGSVTAGEGADLDTSSDRDNALMTKLYELKPDNHDIEVDYRLVEGDAAGVIPAIAAQEGCDLIVIGTHGRSGVRRTLMGSVAEAVSREATCPVMTVRPSIPVTATPGAVGGEQAFELGGGD